MSMSEFDLPRSTATPVPSSTEQALARRVAKLERINAALMAHVERATDQQEGAYSMFQTAIMLEGRVRARTEELTSLMRSLERSNAALKVAKDEAEEANRSKTKFLAAASHDLLQPLNATILSSSSLVDLPLSVEARKIVDQVVRGLRTIEDVIKTLLDISKLDAGVVQPVKKPVRLRGVIDVIEESFRPLTERKGLRFVVRCEDVIVETDVTLVQRVVQNLVSNAVRYTQTGGLCLAVRQRGGRCIVDVVDTGPGIADDERELIFEEFYQGRRTSDAEAGLGLGLSIVRRIAAALGHGLEMRSRVGHGSRFRLTLPLATAAADSRPTGEGSSSFQPGARITVIENDPSTLTALARLLQSWGLQVSGFSSLGEWAKRRDRAPPDLLIADYHLDDGAVGTEAVAEIRARIRSDLPAVIVTADHTEDVERRVASASCDLLLKPVKPAQLRSLLSYVIDARTRTSEPA